MLFRSKQVMEDICVNKAVEFVVENAKEAKASKKSAKAKEAGDAE